MRIYISQTAFSVTVAEFEKHLPGEAVAVPLSYHRYEDGGLKSPLERFTVLQDLRYVLVPWVISAPEGAWSGRRGHISIVDSSFNAAVQDDVKKAIERFPLLWNSDWIHSHPFGQASTWPSSFPGNPGCQGDKDGHMISHRDRNRESGLDFMISMIGCGPRKGGWLLECFSLGENDDIICLGYAKVLPDNDKRVYAALSLPFYRLKRGRRWLLEQIRQLEAMGIKTQQGPLARGWLRLIVTLSKDNRLILALPPRFPKQPPTAIRWTDKFIKLAVDSLVGLPLNEWQLAKLAHKW